MLTLAHTCGTRAAMTLKTLAFPVTLALALSACSERMPDWPWRETPPAHTQAPKAEAPAAAKPAPAAKPAKHPDLKALRPEPRPAPDKEAAAEPAAPPRLVGLSEAETAELLGRPAEEAVESPGKIWTYRAKDCRLSVHLFPDMDKGGFYTLDYTVSEGARETCLGKVAGEARKE